MLALVIERDPLKLEQFPTAVQTWVGAAGGFAAVALVIGLALFLARGARRTRADRNWSLPGLGIATLLGGVFFVLLPVGLRIVWNQLGWVDPAIAGSVSKLPWYQPLVEHFK